MSVQTSKLTEKSQVYPPSPRHERSSQNFLKAAIFCNIRKQVRNASELQINFTNLPKLNPRSCSESMIPKVEHLFSEVDVDDAGSDDICDEGLKEIKTNYKSFTNNLSKKGFELR